MDFFYGFETDSGRHICSLGVFVEFHRGIKRQEFFGTATEITIPPIGLGLADLAIAGQVLGRQFGVNAISQRLTVLC
jgi:hypothetical protein